MAIQLFQMIVNIIPCHWELLGANSQISGGLYCLPLPIKSCIKVPLKPIVVLFKYVQHPSEICLCRLHLEKQLWTYIDKNRCSGKATNIHRSHQVSHLMEKWDLTCCFIHGRRNEWNKRFVTSCIWTETPSILNEHTVQQSVGNYN